MTPRSRPNQHLKQLPKSTKPLIKTDLVRHLFSIPEIQDGIFEFNSFRLSKKDLTRCARVSKAWNRMVIPYIWKDFRLTMGQLEALDGIGIRVNGKWIRNLLLNQRHLLDFLVSPYCKNVTRMEVCLSLPSPPCSDSEWGSESELNPDSDSGGSGSESESLRRYNRRQERILNHSQMCLSSLIDQNSCLTEFICDDSSHDETQEGVFDDSVAESLVATCSHSLHSLTLTSVYLTRSNLGEILNGCKNLKVLDISFCTHTTGFLDRFDGTLAHLEKLRFTHNNVITGFHQTQSSRGQDWMRLLQATINNYNFWSLEVGSSALTGSEALDLVEHYGPLTLGKVSELTLEGCMTSDAHMAKVLDLVHPLKVLNLKGIPFGQESFSMVQSRHQATLKEWSIENGTDGEKIRQGSFNGLQLSRLKSMKWKFDDLSFKVLVPQVYSSSKTRAGEKEGSRALAVQEEMEQNTVSSLAVALEQMKTIFENPQQQRQHQQRQRQRGKHQQQQQQPQLQQPQQHQQQQQIHDWNCPELEYLVIGFLFNPRLELEALGWSRTIQSPEELYVKAFLLLLDQVAKLPKLKNLVISVYCDNELDEKSVHWKELDGCWTRFDGRELDMFRLDWSAPWEIDEKYRKWSHARLRF